MPMPSPRGLCLTLPLAAALLTHSFARAQTKGAEQLIRSRDAVSEPAAAPVEPRVPAPIQIRVGKYLGWDHSIQISNGKVEALVVPAIGRVMQFGFTGETGPFWDDPSLRGKTPDPASTEWINFGGDKSWPSPQEAWARVTPRGWPPPVAFDAMPVAATFRRDSVVLTSAVDPHYGIRCERVVRIEPGAPVLSIVTTYEKVEGPALDVGIWIITQLADPTLVAAPVPARSRFAEGYNRQSGEDLPADLKLDYGMLSMRRDPARATKVGLDSDRLLWVGARHMLLIESPRVPGARYPDQESSAEVYTNPDPKSYVELEMLGPLHSLKPGDRISQTNTYTLFHRTAAEPAADARRVLGLRPGR